MSSLPGRGQCFHKALPGHVGEPLLRVCRHARAGLVSS